MNELEQARQEINEIDREMAVLFERRMKAAEAVAAYKATHGLPVFDGAREAEVIEKNAARIQNEALKPLYITFLQQLMALSKDHQRRLLENAK